MSLENLTEQDSAYPERAHGLTAHVQDTLFHTDAFRITCFKVLTCSKRTRHSWKSCPYAHPGEMARRRPLSKGYSSDMCPHVRSGRECPLGDNCPFSHNTFEAWLHPDKYKTQMCVSGAKCTREVCFFAHSLAELRNPSPGGGSAASSPSHKGSPPPCPSLTSMAAPLGPIHWTPAAPPPLPPVAGAPAGPPPARALLRVGGGDDGGGGGGSAPSGATMFLLLADGVGLAAPGELPARAVGAVAPPSPPRRDTLVSGGWPGGQIWQHAQQAPQPHSRVAAGVFQPIVPPLPRLPEPAAAFVAAAGEDPSQLLALRLIMQHAEESRRAAAAAQDAAARAWAAAGAAAGHGAVLAPELSWMHLGCPTAGDAAAALPSIWTAEGWQLTAPGNC